MWSRASPAMSGALIKKENSAAASGATRPARAEARVMPLRETPGRIATACPQPIRSARRKPTGRWPRGRKRVPASTAPVNIRSAPTMRAFSNKSSIDFLKEK